MKREYPEIELTPEQEAEVVDALEFFTIVPHPKVTLHRGS